MSTHKSIPKTVGILSWIISLTYFGFLVFLSSVEFISGKLTFTEFLLHLLPACLFAFIFVIGQFAKLWGGLLFFGIATTYNIVAWGRFHWSTYILMSAPIYFLAVVHFWKYRSEK